VNEGFDFEARIFFVNFCYFAQRKLARENGAARAQAVPERRRRVVCDVCLR
jgi:hypothetical protein